jgi:hypothetical protein
MMMITPLVALSTEPMRRLRLLIVAGSITFLISILIGRQADAQTSPTVVDPGVKDKIDLSTISKAIVYEASRLKNDVAGWDRKLHELELDLDLKKGEQDFEGMAKDIDECLAVLRAAANRLAPEAEARKTFRKQESALREIASRAEVQSDPAIRKTATYFEQKSTELRALNRSVEEARIELTTQMDRLEAQLKFNAGAGQMSELVRGGRDILRGVQAIVVNAQQIANDLAGLQGKPAAVARPAGTNPARR